MKKLWLLTAILAVLTLCAGETYNFFMLSDTHWGAADSFSTDPAVKTKKDIYRAEKAMPVYRALLADMAKKSDSNTRFLVHAGDMIEGRAKDEAHHKRELQRAWELMEEYFKCPIYLVKGNHDASGPGGKEAFAAYILPKLPGQPTQKSNYTVTCGGDLFIFTELNGAERFIKQVMKKQKTVPRYIFLVIHHDIVLFNNEKVKSLCATVAKHNMIVLSGHTHRTRKVDFAPPTGGRFTMFSVASYMNSDVQAMRYRSTVTDTGNFISRYEKRRCKTPEALQILRQDCIPYISNFEEVSSAERMQGYAKIEVSDSGVEVTIQSGDISQAPFKMRLR